MSSPLVFFVKCEETIPCPCCHGDLELAGRRRRGYKKSSGESITLIIRRLRCKNCGRIHHELPNILVPYKRYEAASIEQVVSESPSSTCVAVDDSTLYRWRAWFHQWSTYAIGCLQAIAKRFNLPVEEQSGSSQTSLELIGQLVNSADGWLARAVRPIVNAHLWVATRSAFMS